MNTAEQTFAQRMWHRQGNWIVLIGFGKILKSLFFVALGFGALHLVHRDLLSLVTKWMTDLRFDPEGHLVSFILEKVTGLNHHKLRMISLAFFLYAAVDALEGVGLVLRRTWAEYLTLLFSASLVPWELFELIRKPSWPKGVLSVVNIAIVWYLASYLQRRQRERQAAPPA